MKSEHYHHQDLISVHQPYNRVAPPEATIAVLKSNLEILDIVCGSSTKIIIFSLEKLRERSGGLGVSRCSEFGKFHETPTDHSNNIPWLNAEI